MGKRTKKLLSMLTALALAASSFSALAVSAGASEIEQVSSDAQLTATNVTYIDENWDSYSGLIVASVGYNNKTQTEPPHEPVVKGDITYTGGVRSNGSISCNATVTDGVLVITSANECTSTRGIKFEFTGDQAIPKASELADDEALEMTFDIPQATNGFTVLGYGDITVADLNGGTKVKITYDKQAGKKYFVSTTDSGEVKANKSDTLSGTETFTGMSFYIGGGVHKIDNLKVEKKQAEAQREITINRYDASDGSLIDTSTTNAGANETYTVEASYKEQFEVRGEESKKVYTFAEDERNKETANAGENEIKLYFNVANTYEKVDSVTLNLKAGETAIGTQEVTLEDKYVNETFDYYYPKYVENGDKLYTTSGDLGKTGTSITSKDMTVDVTSYTEVTGISGHQYYEADNSKIDQLNNRAKWSVGGGNNIGTTLTDTITVAKSGVYDVVISTGTRTDNGSLQTGTWQVNSGATTALEFPVPGQNSAEHKFENITLYEGDVIKVAGSNSKCVVDYVLLTQKESGPTLAPTDTPTPSDVPTPSDTPEPTEEPTPAPLELPFTYDFETDDKSLTATDSHNITFTVDTAETNGATGMVAGGNDGKVLLVGGTKNDGKDGATFNAKLSEAPIENGTIKLSFDIEPIKLTEKKNSTNLWFGGSEVSDTENNPILKINAGTGTNPGPFININGQQATTEYGKYYKVEAEINFDEKTVTAKLFPSDGGEALLTAESELKAENLQYMYLYNTVWTYGSVALDNIKIERVGGAEETPDPNAPGIPVWQAGADGATPGEMETGTFHEKDNVLHVKAKNVFAKLNDVSSGKVTIDTDVYTDPGASTKRTFRIILQNNSAVAYDTATAFAQAAANGDSGNIFGGGTAPNTNDNTAAQFEISEAGWYHINIVVDYDKKGSDDFIQLLVSDDEGTPLGEAKNVPVFAGVDTTLRAIRLVTTASNETYFANFTVTPGSVLAPVEATPTPEPTVDPSKPTQAPEPIETTVHYSESFETHDAGDIIKAATADVPSVTLDGETGKATFTVGSRKDGMNYFHYAAVAQDTETQNKYVDIASSNYSSSNRGVKMFFGDKTDGTTGIEAPAGAGQYLVTEFDVKFDANFVNDSPKKMVLMGDQNIDIDAATTGIGIDTWRSVQVIVEKATGSYVVVVKNKADGKLVTVLNGTTQMTKLNGLNFDNGGPKAGSHAYLDNIKVTTTSEDIELGKLVITVKDNSEEPLPIVGAEVVIEGVGTLTTDASGQVSILVPAGEYKYSITASGYEATKDQADAKTGTVTVTKEGVSEEVTLLKQEYTAEPGSVTIKGGQGTVSAATGDEPNKSAAFTTEVIDQMNIPVADGYTTEWSIFPTGTTEANSAVTIADGVVSVSKDYEAPEGKDAELFDIIAKVTLNGKSAEGKTTVYIANSDIITYDGQTVYAANGRSQTFPIPSAITMPDTDKLRIAFDFTPGTLGSDANAQATTAFVSGSNVLFGLQNTKSGLYAFTTNTISSTCNGSGDTNAFTDFAALGTVDSGTTYPVEFSVLGSKVVVNFNGQFFTLPFTGAEELNIDKIVIGNYRLDTAFGMTVKNLLTASKVNVDENAMDVAGDENVAKIKGKTVTRQYEAVPVIDVDGESFTWTMEPAQYAGVTLSAEGVLSITDAAAPGKVKVIAKSSASEDKKGELEVTIADFQELTLKADGPLAYIDKAGTKGQYVITSAVDGCEDEVKDLITPAWSSSDTGVATIDAASGELTVVGAGKTTVTATVTNDTKVSKVEIPVTVAEYYITADATGNSTEIDMADIVVADKYLVTTADADGNLVKQTEADAPSGILPPITKTVAAEAGVKITAVYTAGNALTSVTTAAVAKDDEIDLTPADANTRVFFWKSLESMEPAKTETKTEEITGSTKLTVDTTGAAKVEVAPIFTTHITGNASGHVVGETLAIPADTYNFEITKASGSRGDIYVNEQMLVNNMLQGGSTVTEYTANDIVVKEGYATIQTYDDTGISADITITKAPSIVTRVPKMYTLGDSLVCIYYNGGSPDNRLAQTGWGQVLQDYITDDVEVVDLGNSGVTAPGLYSSAFTQVRESAQAGDYLVLESGYNDKTYETEESMKTAVRNMVTEAEAKGVEVVLVSPNASHHDYKAEVAWTTYMEDLATELETNYIDLSQLSYDVLFGLYGADGFTQELALATWNVSDRLHSTYNAANKWASVVATELGKLYPEANLVNTEHEYTFQDTAETANTITCKAE